MTWRLTGSAQAAWLGLALHARTYNFLVELLQKTFLTHTEPSLLCKYARSLHPSIANKLRSPTTSKQSAAVPGRCKPLSVHMQTHAVSLQMALVQPQTDHARGWPLLTEAAGQRRRRHLAQNDRCPNRAKALANCRRAPPESRRAHHSPRILRQGLDRVRVLPRPGPTTPEPDPHPSSAPALAKAQHRKRRCMLNTFPEPSMTRFPHSPAFSPRCQPHGEQDQPLAAGRPNQSP